MKVINTGDGRYTIDMQNTLLLDRGTVGEHEGDCSAITIKGGYCVGFFHGRMEASIAALKWIWSAGNGGARTDD